MLPALATARTAAREVPLRGVPVPTHGQGGTRRWAAPAAED